MTWLIIFVGLYFVYCGLLFFFQTKLIFPADMAGQPGTVLPTKQTERMTLATNEGETVAWFIPVPGNGIDSPSPIAVFFHGNAELMDQQQSIVRLYHTLGVSVFMVEYRGYGHSEGTPSERHIVADAVAVLEQVLARDDVDASQLILHGRSIGGGMAAQVARQITPAALIVESTFKSASGMAWRYGAPPFLVRSPLRSARAFEQLDLPILIMHGKQDQIVPLAHAHALEKAGRQTTLVLFEADHNSLPNGKEVFKYEQAVRKHLIEAGISVTPARSSP